MTQEDSNIVQDSGLQTIIFDYLKLKIVSFDRQMDGLHIPVTKYVLTFENEKKLSNHKLPRACSVFKFS
jgi:hypothetical protein